MQLNLTTDYAIRIILYLSQTKQASAQELSRNLNISSQYINFMMSQMRLNRYVRPIAGIKGGYQLKRDPKTIRLIDIVKDMEKTIQISPCLEENEQCLTCHTFETEICPIRKAYEKIQKRWEEKFSSVMIEDLIKEDGRIAICK